MELEELELTNRIATALERIAIALESVTGQSMDGEGFLKVVLGGRGEEPGVGPAVGTDAGRREEGRQQQQAQRPGSGRKSGPDY